MARVTKLQKMAKDVPVQKDAPAVADVTAAGKPVSDEPATMGTDQNRNCLFVLGYFAFVYLAMVAAFWMFGQITHQSDRRLDTMHSARTATEVRDALVAEFGTPSWLHSITTPTVPTASDIIQNSADAVGASITNSVTDAVTNGIQQGAEQAVHDATNQ